MTDPTLKVDTLESKEVRKETRRALQVMIFPGVAALIVEGRQFPLTFAENDVQNFNRKFIAILEALRRDVQTRGIDLTDYAHTYHTQLRDLGRAAYNKVLPRDARTYLAEIEAQEQTRGLSFTFKTPPTFPLFWEMLYAGQTSIAEEDLFWGFRYPLGQTYWEYEAPDRVRLQEGVFSAIHERLDASKVETQHLACFLAEISQSLKRPLVLQLLDQVIPLEDLCAERVMALFHHDEFRYGLIHFACHCQDVSAIGATEAFLSFTAHAQEIEMSLENLLTWQDQGFLHRPFVFLNACESATSNHLLQTLSFPTGILGFGAVGVIATACTIPDNFASAFAAEFYHRLLTKSAPNATANIGEALLETRLHFLQTYNNPLGLAYSLYAVSNQQLKLLD